MSETPKWAVEAAEEIVTFDPHPERIQQAAAIIAAHSPVEALVEALEAIALGEGRCDMEPLQHAANCIEEMKALAQNALALARGGE